MEGLSGFFEMPDGFFGKVKGQRQGGRSLPFPISARPAGPENDGCKKRVLGAVQAGVLEVQARFSPFIDDDLERLVIPSVRSSSGEIVKPLPLERGRGFRVETEDEEGRLYSLQVPAVLRTDGGDRFPESPPIPPGE